MLSFIIKINIEFDVTFKIDRINHVGKNVYTWWLKQKVKRDKKNEDEISWIEKKSDNSRQHTGKN